MLKSKIGEYLNKIAQEREDLELKNKKINNNEILFAYRGEAKDYGITKLMPSIFRDDKYIEKEIYLYELLGDYNVIENSKQRFIEKAIEAQHYVAISRLLDITFNVLSAIFFACSTHLDEDGICFIFGFPNHYSPHSTHIEDVYKNLLSNNNCIYDKNFRVITHSRYNERIAAQDGGFIFFPGKKYSSISSVYYKEILIKAEDKKQLLEDLQYYFDIIEEKMFPSKENDSKVVKNLFDEKQIYEGQEKINIENELNIFFNRLNFEIELKKQNERVISRDLTRILRKEQEDLFFFVNDLEKNYWINVKVKKKVK